MRSFAKYNQSDLAKDEMDGACSTNGGEKEFL
jgi:hypothetical protein